MTLEQLKNSRQEIIATITEQVGAENLKECMEMLVKCIGCSIFEGLNVIEYTIEVLEHTGLKAKFAENKARNAQFFLEEQRLNAFNNWAKTR